MSKDQNKTKKQNVENVDKYYYCRYIDYEKTIEYKCKSKTKKEAIIEGIYHFGLNSKNIEINFNTWFKNNEIIKNIWLRKL